jgi:hypothetical protein
MSGQPASYRYSVPVFLHYLNRIEAILDKVEASGRAEELLAASLAPDMFSAGVQFRVAMGFCLRISLPLAGQEVPNVPAGTTLEGLRDFARDVRERLESLDPKDFSSSRRLRHRAGFADLDQRSDEFLGQFGLPNMLFHLSMAYATLRARGLDIGKADFDGLHSYPRDFSFV